MKTSSPQYYLKERPTPPPEVVLALEEELEEPGKGVKLVCKGCHHVITTTDRRTEVEGKHAHVFANPGGFVYEVGCFTAAPGCRHVDEPSFEFTWFPGYSWQIAACGDCGALMGWRFRAAQGGGGFHGLILPHLVEVETDDSAP